MSATSPASQTTRVTLKHIRFISEPASLAAASALSEAPGKVLMTFVDPFACTAVVTEASPAEIETSDGAASAPDLAVLLVPEGTPDQAQWQRKARQWVEAGDGPAPIRIVVDEDASILWRPGRAVIIAPAAPSKASAPPSSISLTMNASFAPSNPKLPPTGPWPKNTCPLSTQPTKPPSKNPATSASPPFAP